MNLSEFDKMILTLLRALGTGTHRHISEQAIFRLLPEPLRHDHRRARKLLRSAQTKGLVRKHPTRGEITYQWTVRGIEYVRDLLARI